MIWTLVRRVAAPVLMLALAACGGSGEPGPEPAAMGAPSTVGAVPGKHAQAYQSATNFTGNGWYWNAAEPGTGFMFEAQGDAAFVGFFMYEAGTGKPVWYAAYGDFFADDAGNHYFFGDLRRYANGQAISAATVPPNGSSSSLGAVSVRFPAAGGAAVLLPGGRAITATRFDFNGLGGSPRASQPETGWYWNPAEGGRGYAIEVQNDQLFMAMFHYNEDGSPTWNVVKGDISTGVLTAPFITYDGGQSLTSAFVPAGTESLRGPLTLAFGNPCAGQVQRAGAPATPIRRFPIPGSTLAPGAECRALQTLADVSQAELAGNPTTLTATELAAVPTLPRLQPGDAVFGKIDAPLDADRYAVLLTAGVPYRISAKGASSQSGSLPDPFLVLYGPDGNVLAAFDDIDGSNLDASLAFTPSTTGLYLLGVMSSPADQSGTFVLEVAGGVASALEASPVRPLGSLAGTVNGLLRGRDGGSFTLTVGADGRIGGSVTLGSDPGTPLPVSGAVQIGGVFQLTAGALAATGYLGPQGDLTGTWSSAGAAGGVFIGDRSGANVLGNRAPRAIITNSGNFVFGSPLPLLDNSTDPDGDALTVRWHLVSSPAGSAARIADPTSRSATLHTDVRGPYVLALTVSDGKTDGAPAQVTLNAVGSNVLPVADAGPSRTVALGSVVTLDGRGSTDPDSPLTYRWEIVEQPPGGATVAFTREMAASPQPLFFAQSAGVYVARLTVSDEQSVSRSDVSITVLPPEGALPVAQAPQNVVFTGIGSSVRVRGRSAARGPVISIWRVQTVPEGSAVPVDSSQLQSTDYPLHTDLAGAYGLEFEVYDDFTEPLRVGRASAQVLAVDLAGRWAGPVGLFTTLSSPSISLVTLSSGALTGRLHVVFHVCGLAQIQDVQFAAPLRLFDASGNRASFTFDSGVRATLEADLSSGTAMSGTLSLDLPTTPGCGAQTLVLPWSAARIVEP